MKVKLEDMEQMISIILRQYKEFYADEIEMKNDFYWKLDENELYAPNMEPRDFSLGQLTDDWDTLQNSAKSGDLVPYVYISTKVTPPFRAKVAASLTAGCSKN
jgi:hypothetical protein